MKITNNKKRQKEEEEPEKPFALTHKTSTSTKAHYIIYGFVSF